MPTKKSTMKNALTKIPSAEPKKNRGEICQNMSKNEMNLIDFDEVLVMRVREALGDIVKELISENSWTQAQAAEYLGINQPRVSDIVNGRVNRHSVDKLIECLDIFGYSIDFTLSKKNKRVKGDVRKNS